MSARDHAYKSPHDRTRAVLAALAAGPQTIYEIAAATSMPRELAHLYVHKLRLAEKAILCVEKRACSLHKSRVRELNLYALTGAAEAVPYAPRKSAVRQYAGIETRAKPVKRTQSSGGQVAGKCISRQYKWHTRTVW